MSRVIAATSSAVPCSSSPGKRDRSSRTDEPGWLVEDQAAMCHDELDLDGGDAVLEGGFRKDQGHTERILYDKSRVSSMPGSGPSQFDTRPGQDSQVSLDGDLDRESFPRFPELARLHSALRCPRT